ncbi:MAG TPA: hybrid sensor histidine kinase/response regulator [Gammaproteobacteria bacterium]|nr:hybrid sensor histidine kinase/response regulator [Gammaproteobacteria bacterium]
MNKEAGASSTRVSRADLSATGVAQGVFIGHLVHELRNLLAPMGNITHLLRMRSAEDARLAPPTAMLERQIASVGRLLEKLTTADTLLRTDARLTLTPQDLRPLVDEAVARAREEIARRQRQLEVLLPAEPVPIAASATQLGEVLREVIDNALRYTRDGGRIEVKLDTQDGMARLRVRDDGRGIANERLAQIFTPRCLLPSVAPEDRGGLGLSLAIAARVLALHEGRIDAASEGPGTGSEFTLYLPLCPAPTPTQQDAAPEAASPAHRRVLVVDDSDAMQDSLTTMLEELGQQVRSARDGEEALRIAADWEPDLVLLDINLPKLNGFRVARALRERYPPERMSLVMMAGDGLDDAMRRGAQEAGVDRCIDKMQAGIVLRELLAPGT